MQDTEPATPTQPHSPLALACAAVCVAVGVTVVAGWHTGSEVLIAVRPGYTAVQYNTALSFVACGVALAGCVLGWRRRTLVAAAFVIAIAGLTAFEYATGTALGIDTFFFQPHHFLPAGRMAPNTAVALLASGVSFVLLTYPSPRRLALASILAAAVAALGVVPATGYLAGLPAAYRWGSVIAMAVPTSFVLVAIGAGLLAAAWQRSRSANGAIPRWIPVPALVFSSGISVMLALAVRHGSDVIGLSAPAVRSLAVAAAMTLVFGIGMSAALAAAIKLAVGALHRSRELAAVNRVLDVEVERRLAVNRSLRMVSACNQAIAHAVDEPDLLHRICELAVDLGGYRLAWIGFAEHDACKTVRVAAKEGRGRDYVTDRFVTWSDEPRGQGPTGTAIRTGRPVTCPDLLTDPSFLPWRDRAVEFGFGSSLVLPLRRDGEADAPGPSQDAPRQAPGRSAFGALSIYAADKNAFHRDEVELFEQLAADVSFGIATLRTRAAHRAAEDKLRFLVSAVESSDDAIVTKTLEGNILSWNAGAARLYGYAAHEIVGQNIRVLLPPGQEEEMHELLEHLRQGQSLDHYETVRRRKDATLVNVSVTLSPVQDHNGKLVAASSITRDITERKRAEMALAASEERYRSLAIATAQIVWTTDAEGLVRSDMPTWREFTGASFAQIQGSGWLQSLHPDDRERTAQLWTEAVQHRRMYETEYRIRRHDGEYRHVWVRGVPILGADGALREWVGACTDITERKAVHLELERFAHELQRSNTELQEFAFVASHDLQEPLRKIVAFSERLRDRAAGQLDEVSQDYMARMHNAALRMSHLIESLLEYSRITTRARPFEDVDLAALMLGVLADLEQRIRETRAVVRVGVLPHVLGDATQLRQLLQNLLTNALKFRAAGVAPRVVVRAELTDGRWQISCTDQGIGFDPSYAEKIFRPFQRLHGRNEYEGSGMGLAICRKIAQRHGTAIAVRSQHGHGATFTISLSPVPERTEPCPKSPSASCLPKMTMTTTC